MDTSYAIVADFSNVRLHSESRVRYGKSEPTFHTGLDLARYASVSYEGVLAEICQGPQAVGKVGCLKPKSATGRAYSISPGVAYPDNTVQHHAVDQK